MSLIPNILTVLRLIMIPVFVAVFIFIPDAPEIALMIYAIAMLTDALDGKIARAFNCTSRFGTLADPLADKLMTLAVVVCLAWSQIIPLPAMLLVAIRELTMISVGAVAAKNNIVIAACFPGKLATLLFTVALVFLIPWHGVHWLIIAASFVLYIAICTAFYAAFYYMAILRKRIAEYKQISI